MSMAATHSGWCQSVALCLSCWNVNKVCRGVAWSEACMVNRLTGVYCGLKTFEEELSEEFPQEGHRTDGPVVGR